MRALVSYSNACVCIKKEALVRTGAQKGSEIAGSFPAACSSAFPTSVYHRQRLLKLKEAVLSRSDQ
jgi:hypothetical protein